MKIAIIGCGAVTEQGHLPAAARCDNVIVTALVDKNVARAQTLAQKFNVPEVADDYTKIFDMVDAVIVALPHHLHAPVSTEFLKRGIHVLVEKPMALSTAECDAMLVAAEKGQAVLAVGLMRRFLNSARFARWVLDEGILGRIHAFDVREGNVYNWPVQSAFFFRLETAGGGVLFDTGSHTLDLLLWLLGDVSDFDYYDDSYGGVEADCKLHLTMKSGAKGVVELSRTRDLRNTFVIHGEHGTMEMHLRHNWSTLRTPDNTAGLAGYGFAPGSPESTEQRFGDLFPLQLEDWLAAIRGEHPPTVPGTEARRSIVLIENCYAQKQQWELPWVFPERKGELI